MKTIRRLLRRPVRIDRPVEHEVVFDLEVVERGLRESLLVAGLFRRPARYVKPRRNDVQAREG